MLDRVNIRFWIPIVASAGFFPMVIFLMLGGWYVRLYFAPSTEVAAVPAAPSVRTQVEAAASPPPVAVAEPATAPLQEPGQARGDDPPPVAMAETAPAQSTPAIEPVSAPPPPPESLTTMQMVSHAHSIYFDPALDASSAVEPPTISPPPAILDPAAPMATLVPLVRAPAEAPMPEQDATGGVAEAPAVPPGESAFELAPALPMFATFAVAPPTQFAIKEPIPLPRPKPKVARVSRPVPLAPPQPAENSPRPISVY
jgi:hypothetical protein